MRDTAGKLIVHPAGEPWVVNPLVQAEQDTDESTGSRLTGTLASELRLPGGFGWQARYGVDRRHQDERIARPLDYYPQQRTGTAHRASTMETLVTLERGRPAAHRIELLAGLGRRPSRDSLYSEKTSAGGGAWVYGWSNVTRRWYLARAAYALRERYFLTLTARQDGYDELPAGARNYRTAALGAAWQLDQMPFVRRLGVFSQLRLRGSLGRTTFPPSIDARDLPQQPPWGLVAWSYDPERLDQLDAGVDAGLLDGRIAAVLDVYRRDSRNQGVLAPVAAGTNYSNYGLVQGAATRNTGVELALSTVNLRGWHGLDWTTELALAHNHDQVTRLPYGVPALGGSFVGLPPNDATEMGQAVFYDYRALGVWQQGEAGTPGAIHIDDVTQDGRIGFDDRVILGTSYPTLVGSLANRVRWGAFHLSVLVAARLGYTIQEPYAPGITGFSVNYRYNALQQEFWTPAHPSNAAPRPGLDSYSSSLSYRSGSHWRVRQVTLGWRLPAALARGAAATLYAGARNPWISGDFRGYDPEFPALGAPPYRTVFLGAATSF